MRDLGTTIEALLAMGALGGSVGTVVQGLVTPQFDGPFHGAIVGAIVGAAAFGGVQIRRAFRAVAHGPEAVGDGPVDAIRIDRMNEPFAAVTSRPLMLGGLGFVTGSLIERSAGVPTNGPILGVSLALVMFAINMMLSPYLRSRLGTSLKGSAAASNSVARTRARGLEFLREGLVGGAAATALCGAVGTLIERLYPAATDAGIYGIGVGILLYGLWLLNYIRRP